ncbi:MAG: hypothetical protein Ct9H300mP11_32950 [Chloroflexota bacterium]|nr:MAG: hypothetical protein Ct9H300mP11_32950 [Chloroflexota bacterium]
MHLKYLAVVKFPAPEKCYDRTTVAFIKGKFACLVPRKAPLTFIPSYETRGFRSFLDIASSRYASIIYQISSLPYRVKTSSRPDPVRFKSDIQFHEVTSPPDDVIASAVGLPSSSRTSPMISLLLPSKISSDSGTDTSRAAADNAPCSLTACSPPSPIQKNFLPNTETHDGRRYPAAKCAERKTASLGPETAEI